MQYRYQRPDENISAYVRTILVVESSSKGPLNNKLPLFTNGIPALVCKITRSPALVEGSLHITLFGKSTPASIWNPKKNEIITACFFKPFALATIFNLPAKELIKAPVELSQWNAIKTIALKKQFAGIRTSSQITGILVNFLKSQIRLREKECEIILHATDQIMLNPGKEILAELMREMNVNERTFQRMFKKFVGVSPNQYRRICQFKDSFDQLKNGRFNNLGDVSFAAGFSDQSHFIRSFKEFTDITPKDYKKSGLK